jgi:hypothetical protein
MVTSSQQGAHDPSWQLLELTTIPACSRRSSVILSGGKLPFALSPKLLGVRRLGRIFIRLPGSPVGGCFRPRIDAMLDPSLLPLLPPQEDLGVGHAVILARPLLANDCSSHRGIPPAPPTLPPKKPGRSEVLSFIQPPGQISPTYGVSRGARFLALTSLTASGGERIVFLPLPFHFSRSGPLAPTSQASPSRKLLLGNRRELPLVTCPPGLLRRSKLPDLDRCYST